jgi:ferredoxin-NADP reductase
VFDGDEVQTFQGAERLWRFKVGAWVRRRGALALRFAFGEWSPNSLMTGSWEQAAARRAAETLRNRWRPFRVAKVVDESAVVRSFHLEPADGAGLPLFAAGQHLPLRIDMPGHERPLLRNYTISAAPPDDLLRISVKRDGLVSSWLHAHGAVGTEIQVRAPEGDFGIDPTIKRPAVLLSAGIGITPMLAMLRQLVYEGLRTRGMRPTWFVHGARNLAERPFDRELAELAGRAGRSLGIMRALSQPGPEATRGVDYEVEGRVDVALLKSFLPLDDYDFFLCGPAPFMQSLYDGLRELRIADERIHAEAFGPSSLRRRPDAATAAVPIAQPATVPVPVIFADSAKEARWEPGGGTLLELAESRGLTPEYSCRGGSCGTCRTKLVEGAVAYPTAPSASRVEGTALVCCAVPAAGSARVVLAL